MQFIIKNFLSFFKLAFSYLRSESYPFITVLRLNDACNLACNYCDSYKFKKFIPIESLIYFLDKCYSLGCRSFVLTGGEPFLYPEREALMSWFSQKKCYIIINTNGKLIGNEQYQNFLQLADEALVSIDGPEFYTDQHRGIGTHKNILKVLDYLFKEKKKITLSVVLTKKNALNLVLEYILEIKKKYNTGVGFNPITSDGRINNDSYSKENALDENDLSIFSSFIERNSKYFPDVPKLLLNYFSKPSPFKCKTTQFSLYVDVNEKIYPCINVTDRSDAQVGDIKTYTGKIQKTVTCKKCSCTPLIISNLMMQDKFPKPKYVFSILSRFVRL